ncbi:MAG: CPBP family intramembrane metalloprotease [Clostridia bacterium]|nr:CPBP family intramembrane metalloprotease [Clostridia bacterium]
MQKLLQKSPLAFALFCIGIYVVGMSAADEASTFFGVEKSFSLAFSLLFSLLLLRITFKSSNARNFGLCRPVHAKAALYFVPLFVLCSINFWLGVQMNLGVLETVLYVCSMVCVGFLEEIIFRAFLYRAMEKDSPRAAVIVSSLTFGIGHVVNLLSGADLVPTLCQIVYATVFGFVFVLLFSRTRSLLPCIAAHAFINATSAFAAEALHEGTALIVTSLVLAVGGALYALYLYRALPKEA